MQTALLAIVRKLTTKGLDVNSKKHYPGQNVHGFSNSLALTQLGQQKTHVFCEGSRVLRWVENVCFTFPPLIPFPAKRLAYTYNYNDVLYKSGDNFELVVMRKGRLRLSHGLGYCVWIPHRPKVKELLLLYNGVFGLYGRLGLIQFTRINTDNTEFLVL